MSISHVVTVQLEHSSRQKLSYMNRKLNTKFYMKDN